MFATEDDAVQWFEGWHWPALKVSCRRLRQPERLTLQDRHANAVSVPELQAVLQLQARHCDGLVGTSVSDVELGNLPRIHQFQGRLSYDTAPESRHLVPAAWAQTAADPGGVC